MIVLRFNVGPRAQDNSTLVKGHDKDLPTSSAQRDSNAPEQIPIRVHIQRRMQTSSQRKWDLRDLFSGWQPDEFGKLSELREKKN